MHTDILTMTGTFFRNRGKLSLTTACCTFAGIMMLMLCIGSHIVIKKENVGQIRLEDNLEVEHRSRIKRATNYVSDSMNKTDSVNIVSWKIMNIYGYENYKQRFPDKEPTVCYDKNGIDKNGTSYENFTCPLPEQSKDFTECCKNRESGLCCKPDKGDKSVSTKHRDIYTAVGTVAAFVVCVTFCMLLYCCCCQKRHGVHSGKLIWIKKKKNKTVYEEGGLSPRESPDDPDEETRIIGFIAAPDDDSNPKKRRKSIEHAVDRLNEYDAHTSPGMQHKFHTGSGSKPMSLGSPMHELSIPLINIQPSTPDQ